jgi:ribosomal protein S18 acetylase RimI-like enzyme
MTIVQKVREDQITLRRVAEADDHFLLCVYSSTRAQEMAVVPWSAEQKQVFIRMQYTAQKDYYRKEFPQATHEIICLDHSPVGRLYIDRQPDTLHILDITILPQHRGRGAGSHLLCRLLHDAAEASIPVTVYVESLNPSLRFFERLGFQKDREDGFQVLMKFQPPTQ